MNKKLDIQKLREELARHAHKSWSKWMRHVFSCGRFDEDSGEFIVNEESVKRWLRQAWTDYYELSEVERNSDRKEADDIMLFVLESFDIVSIKDLEQLDEKDV